MRCILPFKVHVDKGFLVLPDEENGVKKCCHVGLGIITISIQRAHRERVRKSNGKMIGLWQAAWGHISLPLTREIRRQSTDLESP